MKQLNTLLLIFLICYITSCTPPVTFNHPTSHLNISKVPLDSANKMIESYIKSIDTNNINNPDLYSLIFSANALRAYLADSSITELKIMLAHTLSYINEGNDGVAAGYKADALTLILAAYDAEENYVYVDGNYAVNKGKPCPRNCPTIGTASSKWLD